jgi:hypothetical protein
MGHQECQAEAGSELGGYWGPCVDAHMPQAEVCGDGLDQDCDGEDLQCECTPSCEGKVCGEDGCAGYCGSPPHACQTTTQQKKALMRQFFECLGCCDLDGLFAGQGLPPCSAGSPIEHHYYGGKKPGKPPTKPPYCIQLDLISDFPPCAGVAGQEAPINNVTLHIGDCEEQDPGVHEMTYQRTCTQ